MSCPARAVAVVVALGETTLVDADVIDARVDGLWDIDERLDWR